MPERIQGIGIPAAVFGYPEKRHDETVRGRKMLGNSQFIQRLLVRSWRTTPTKDVPCFTANRADALDGTSLVKEVD